MGFFESLFGPSREAIWTALREQIGGEVAPGTFWRGERLQVRVADWVVTLEEHTTHSTVGKVPIIIHHTRLRAPFPNPNGFCFTIHRASIFSSLGKLLGMQDITVGHEEFDEKFVIKGNDERLVRSLCDSERFRALVMKEPNLRLSIQDDEGWFGTKYPPGVDVLVLDIAEHIRDVERLKGLYDVFAEALDKLSRLGVAGKGTGGVTP